MKTDQFEVSDVGPGYLELLDPSSDDESYWGRSRFRVMTRVADELFRRRIAADASVVGVMESWSKTLVPVAALTAVLAGVLLVSNARATATHADFEEALLLELGDPIFPPVLEAEPLGVRFASEEF